MLPILGTHPLRHDKPLHLREPEPEPHLQIRFSLYCPIFKTEWFRIAVHSQNNLTIHTTSLIQDSLVGGLRPRPRTPRPRRTLPRALPPVETTPACLN